MIRIVVLLLAACTFAAALATPAQAQKRSDSYEIKPDNEFWSGTIGPDPDFYYTENGQISGQHHFKRNFGYFSFVKITLFICLFLVWVKTCDWANQDATKIGLNKFGWNAVMVLPFLFGFPLFGLLFPIFWLSFPISCMIYAIPMLTYVKYRNKHVTVDERVLTKAHIRFLMSRGNIGVAKEKKAPWQDGPKVDFGAMGAADDQANQANLLKSRQLPQGYVAAKQLFVAGLAKRAEMFMLDYTQAEVGVKYYIDGVWHDMPPANRETGDPMLASLKLMANLNPEDRRSKQEGKISAKYADKKYVLKLASQGTKTGERVIIQITGNEKKYKSLGELGMREKMEQQVLKVLGAKTGLFVFTSMPGGGLTTMVTVGMTATDRLMRDWRGTEEEGKPEPYIENVDIAFYNPAKNESPATVLPSLLRKEPDALLVRDFINKETFDIVLAAVNEKERIVVTTVRAKDAIEGVLRLMQMKPDPKEFAKALTGVLNVRMCRKLCDSCKEAYQPPPETLRKLGLPAGRVTELYRQRQPPPPDTPEAKKYEPCKRCAELGYVERTGIFEFLEVSDKFREALIKQPQLDVLRKIARSEGYRTLQEEGIVMAAKGITSVAEVSRVLKA